MKNNSIKDKAEMVYSLTFKNEEGKEQKYKFWFTYFGENFWNTNWAVYIENENNEKDWEYHELAGCIIRGEFNASHPYEWIIIYAHTRWLNSTEYVCKRIS